jgi:type I restriction enzyme, R subunit
MIRSWFALERLPSVISRRTQGPVSSNFRQYGETLAQLVAAKAGLYRDAQEPQADLLRRLKFDRVITPQVGDFFHHLRTVGNKAAHENEGTHAEALTALKIARAVGIWFHRTFGAGKSFSPGAFVPPPDPTAATHALTAELARLRAELDQSGERVRRTISEKLAFLNLIQCKRCGKLTLAKPNGSWRYKTAD